MKKTYQKPQILFESFCLSTNIAGSCELTTNLPSPYSCPYNAGSDRNPNMIFMTRETGCNYTPPDGTYNGHCYHNPTDSKNMFNS